MGESESLWGISSEAGALARFPAEGTVMEPKPFQERVFSEVDVLLAGGRCPDGRFEIESGGTRLICLIHQSQPLLAGLQERDVFSHVPLYDFAIRARQLGDATCSMVRSDNSCVLMIGVHFCKRPFLQGSTKLVNLAHVLRVLARQQQDAALALERAGRRSLVFLSHGQPARLFFADPADDPREGTLSDRILLYAFADSAPPGKVEVYTSLHLPDDPDRGRSLADLAATTRPCPPAMVFIHMADGREVRRRPFLPPAMVVGRDPTCNLFIDNLAVSRRHARLSWERGHFVIEDLESANGTLVNGKQVQRAALAPGDRVEVAKFQITLAELSTKLSAPETLHVQIKKGPPPLYLVGDDLRVEVQHDVLIGRGQGVDVPARGFSVAPVHARISRAGDGGLELTCFGGKKVRVNGSKVAASRLAKGDAIEVGRTKLRVAAEDDAA